MFAFLRRVYLPKVEFRFGLLALAAVILQLLALFAPLGSDDARRILFVLSYGALMEFILFNLRRPGLLVLGVGVALNFIPVMTNGGLMPVTPETMMKTGDIPAGVEVGEWVPHSKDVLKEREDINFYFLSDRLTIEGQSVIRAFSIGDVAILAGLVLVVGEVLFPRIQPIGQIEAKHGEKRTPDSFV